MRCSALSHVVKDSAYLGFSSSTGLVGIRCILQDKERPKYDTAKGHKLKDGRVMHDLKLICWFSHDWVLLLEGRGMFVCMYAGTYSCKRTRRLEDNLRCQTSSIVYSLLEVGSHWPESLRGSIGQLLSPKDLPVSASLALGLQTHTIMANFPPLHRLWKSNAG